MNVSRGRRSGVDVGAEGRIPHVEGGAHGSWGKVPRTGRKWGKPGRSRGCAPTLQDVPGLSGRVLVVDDNKVIRQLIRVNLELEGFEVVTAADGAECLEIVHQVRPDVITLDVVMPRLDGLHTASRLRADARTCHVPVAIISACTQYEMDSGKALGVDAFLAKPFEPVDLVELVRRLMRQGAAGAAAPGDAESVVGPTG